MISETSPDLSLIARQNEQILSVVACLQDDLSMLRARVVELHERISKLEQDRLSPRR